MKTAAATADLARLRRISLALQVMSVLKIGRLWSLTSGNKRERLLALAAVGIGTTRPLLAAAIILRENDRAVRELSRVLPQHRRVIERICGLSQDLGRPLPGLSKTGHPPCDHLRDERGKLQTADGDGGETEERKACRLRDNQKYTAD
ncbi:hypothetical protein ABMC89_16590 [Sulfitobacter sp. HNIBRBA3233]|uniref:hypothetical protein n=1 Tax=Sulfitobacter marinivivus TaxID=3158558 RepID=UPI0032DF0847